MPLTFTAQTEAASSQCFETNAFRLLRQTSAEGQIAMAYVFPVNSAELSEQGYTQQQIETYRFYLTTYVNALAKNNAMKATEGTTVGTCQYFSDVDGLGFVMTFEDAEAQNRFFGVSESGQSSSDKESSGFFVKKTTIKTSFPFSKTSAGNFKMVCLMAVSSWANDQNLSEQQTANAKKIFDDSLFIYDFATQQSGLKSELMYEDENLFHNVFIKKQEDLENASISFWTEMPNYPIWYLTALIVVVVGMVVAFVVSKKKLKTRNKKS